MKTWHWLLIAAVVGYVLFAYRGRVTSAIASINGGPKAVPPNRVA